MDTKVFTHYRSPLRLAKDEEHYLWSLVGVSRWVYNWGLNQQEQRMTQGLPRYSKDELLGLLKGELAKPDQKWLWDAPSDLRETAINNCCRAYELWERQNQSASIKGYIRNKPHKKTRDKSRASYQLKKFTLESKTRESGKVRYVIKDRAGHTYHLSKPNLIPTYLQGKQPYLATIKREDGQWTITLSYCEETVPTAKPTGNPVGVDMGFRSMAVSSEGSEIKEYPSRDLSKGQQERLIRLYKALKRSEKGSKNHQRIQAKIDRLRYRKRNIQSDNHHKVSSEILRCKDYAGDRPRVLVIDHLNFTQIAGNRPDLEQSVKRENLYQLVLKLKFKAERQGTKLVISTDFPSSKTCHKCGFHHKDLGSAKVFTCPRCDYKEDRDYNAAKNLRDYPEDHDWKALVAKKEQAYLQALWDKQSPTTPSVEWLDQQAPTPIGQGSSDWDDFVFEQ